MKKWKREIIECGTTILFASGVWYWVSQEWKKPPQKAQIEKSVKIYDAAWHKDGYLEVKK